MKTKPITFAAIGVICGLSLLCLVSTCGTFDASYTDKTGATYHGGFTVPTRGPLPPIPADPKDGGK